MSQTVRVGETEYVVFTLTRNGTAFDLTNAQTYVAGVSGVILRRKTNLGAIDTTTNATGTGLLSVTSATAGEVTLKPNAAWWASVDHYDVYIEVLLAGVTYAFPRITNERFLVVDRFS